MYINCTPSGENTPPTALVWGGEGRGVKSFEPRICLCMQKQVCIPKMKSLKLLYVAKPPLPTCGGGGGGGKKGGKEVLSLKTSLHTKN